MPNNAEKENKEVKEEGKKVMKEEKAKKIEQKILADLDDAQIVIIPKEKKASNTKQIVEKYLKVEDWRVKENSTVTYSVGGLILSNSGAVTADYWLNEIYDEEIAKAHKNCEIHLHDLSMLTGYCFTGDTKVKTLDGKNPTFEELVKNKVRELYVYAYDNKTDTIVPAKAINPRVTKETKELIEITLSTKEKIRCTPDHRFMLRDGSYVEAKNLKPNMSLMPLYISEGRYNSIRPCWNNTKKRLYVHRWVMEQKIGRGLYENEVIHHINGDKKDNRPENLSLMFDKIHRSMEISKTMKKDIWKNANEKRLINFNKSEEKRKSVSEFAKNRVRNAKGNFVSKFQYIQEADKNKTQYNHTVRNVRMITLKTPIKVYDLTVPKYENFAIGGNVFCHNCAGWSLKQLIKEGLGGVPGKIASSPASHLSTLCNQMVNFLGVMQNEWAGAQAFSSFDTYLAPFVKADKLDYKQVKQCIQSFIYGVNTPSRWGCVDTETEVLTTKGFKKYNELKKGDEIYTWKNGKVEINKVNEVVIKQYNGKMHEYSGRNYIQFVSPDHRVLVKEHNKDSYIIKHSNEIFGSKTAYALPTKFKSGIDCQEKMSDEEIIDAIKKDSGNIEEKYLSLNSRQSKIYLDTLMSLSGEKAKIKCDEKNIEKIQHIALRAGYTTYIQKEQNFIYVVIRNEEKIYPTKRKEVDYNGIIWCPNVDNGTAIFRKDGCVFISGQCQSPFTNITLDWTVPNDLAELPAIVGGKEMNFKYKDCKKEMDMVNKAFIETMIEGDYNGRGFQYPIPTYSITKDFDWSETENNKLLFEMAAKYGTPYFSNYVNSDMNPSDVRSMCCRLRLDLRELRKKSGGFFGSGESTGSVGVVTINMPRLAYTSSDEEEFFKKLEKLMDISARSLKIKRETITKFMEEGLYPYTKRYLGTFNNHFSTIGLVGMNECCLNAKWLKKNLTDAKAVKFTKKVLNFMREKLSDYQEQYGDLYNLEATPAESTSYRFAKHDKEKYPNIISANMDGTPYYTNSSHLPVGATDDIFNALDVQDELQTLYTSGTVFHTFLGEKLPDWKSAANLVKTIATNYHLPYYTLSPTYSICKNHGYIAGEVYQCPVCGEKTEVNSRITGYYRPVQNWNDGKVAEFKDRKEYTNEIIQERMKEINKRGVLKTKEEIKEEKEIKKTEVKKSTKEKSKETKEETTKPENRIITTKTCPNCLKAKELLDDAKIKYEVVDALENVELCKELNITQSPTFITKDGTKYVGLSKIIEYLEKK